VSKEVAAAARHQNAHASVTRSRGSV
jgi:hypothetical protein